MNNEIILYQTGHLTQRIEVRLENETVWLSQEQMSTLFQRDQSVISRHICNVFKEGELEEKSNMQKMHIANSDKPVVYYNLDVIISVGYRFLIIDEQEVYHLGASLKDLGKKWFAFSKLEKTQWLTF